MESIDDIVENIDKLANRETLVLESMIQISYRIQELNKRKPVNRDESTAIMFEIKELGDDFIRKEIQLLRIKTEALKQLVPEETEFIENEIANIEKCSNKISAKMQDFCNFKIEMNAAPKIEEMLNEVRNSIRNLSSIIRLGEACIHSCALIARGYSI